MLTHLMYMEWSTKSLSLSLHLTNIHKHIHMSTLGVEFLCAGWPGCGVMLQ